MLLILLLIICSCSDSKRDYLKKIFLSHKGKYALVVIKNKFALEVYGSDFKKINSYIIGFGSNPDMLPKLHEGDNRTPEGIYEINEILSMDAGRDSQTYTKLRKMNEVYFKAKDGYHKYKDQTQDLGDNAYGPRYYGINYPNMEDRKRYQKAIAEGRIPLFKGRTADIGYGIAIHGNNDEASIGHLCSSGCIRMYNRDIVDIEKYLMLSTPVIILSE
jgi:lipoprotein-anchoring transpeptidase ErfK/SrfK